MDEKKSKYAPQIKNLRKNYVRFSLDFRPEELERFRQICAANQTAPTTVIKHLVAAYCAEHDKPGPASE